MKHGSVRKSVGIVILSACLLAGCACSKPARKNYASQAPQPSTPVPIAFAWLMPGNGLDSWYGLRFAAFDDHTIIRGSREQPYRQGRVSEEQWTKLMTQLDDGRERSAACGQLLVVDAASCYVAFRRDDRWTCCEQSITNDSNPEWQMKMIAFVDALTLGDEKPAEPPQYVPSNWGCRP